MLGSRGCHEINHVRASVKSGELSVRVDCGLKVTFLLHISLFCKPDTYIL